MRFCVTDAQQETLAYFPPREREGLRLKLQRCREEATDVHGPCGSMLVLLRVAGSQYTGHRVMTYMFSLDPNWLNPRLHAGLWKELLFTMLNNGLVLLNVVRVVDAVFAVSRYCDAHRRCGVLSRCSVLLCLDEYTSIALDTSGNPQVQNDQLMPFSTQTTSQHELPGPPQVAEPMRPIVAASAVTFFLASKAQDIAVKCSGARALAERGSDPIQMPVLRDSLVD
ncbi:uncharacterized protein B0H18DRAFT_953931 [Fomitopsis serialis]|uniref:uncharacterized protein n=1 Tax=Fomitopsis serialis TaxID=139415 RepID=UPI002008810C|nr:uncharacterized protein B0H18DRAFT_953931 [Neoantrodia serialis]KAH9928706.1 hypothetical protein B0H18DRAFT_953931 [Neoantrodia serialis]